MHDCTATATRLSSESFPGGGIRGSSLHACLSEAALRHVIPGTGQDGMQGVVTQGAALRIESESEVMGKPRPSPPAPSSSLGAESFDRLSRLPSELNMPVLPYSLFLCNSFTFRVRSTASSPWPLCHGTRSEFLVTQAGWI